MDERLNTAAPRRKIVGHDQRAHHVSPFDPIPTVGMFTTLVRDGPSR